MDNLIAQMKNLESLLQSLLQSQKMTDGHLERLKSIEQLLERTAGAVEMLERSNQRLLEVMEKAWQSYEAIGTGKPR